MISLTLKELQEKFFQSLQNKELDPNIDFYENDIFKKEERLLVYASAYHIRLMESISDDFIKLKNYLREPQWEQLVLQFIANNPSKYESLIDYGLDFVPFVKKIYGDTSPMGSLAEFEWTLNQSLYGDIVEPDFQKWEEQLIESPESIVLQFQRHVYLMFSPWSLDRMYQKYEQDPVPHQSAWLINKVEDEVIYRELEIPQAKILQKLMQGMSLGEALNEAEELTPESLQDFFSILRSDNLILSVATI